MTPRIAPVFFRFAVGLPPSFTTALFFFFPPVWTAMEPRGGVQGGAIVALDPSQQRALSLFDGC